MAVRQPFRQDPLRPLQIFALEINTRPTLVFEATGLAEAIEISLDRDFRADLKALTSEGIPICAEDSVFAPRPATEEEISAFKHALERAPDSDEPTMAFLVKIDGVMVVAVDTED
jgi:hypothetical protein